jgi:hypothetical protein
MHKSATKCNKTLGKWCKNKNGASKIIDTFETYQWYTHAPPPPSSRLDSTRHDVRVRHARVEWIEPLAEFIFLLLRKNQVLDGRVIASRFRSLLDRGLL